MIVYIVDTEDNEIINYDSESCPYKEGEIIDITIHNYNKEVYDVENLNQRYKVKKISHMIERNYRSTGHVKTTLITTVEVEEIK